MQQRHSLSLANVFDNFLGNWNVNLEDRSAIVTGASTGIGRATALTLADAGANVSLAARTKSNLESVREGIESTEGDALVIPTDVRERDQVESMIAETLDAFGGLDIMVNNAGVGHWEREGIVDGDLDEWRLEIEVNLLGVMYGTHLAASVMRDSSHGDIVNVGSGSGRHPFPQWPSYVASKYGVRGFTESALRDLREDGIRVTHILPGEVETPMQPEEDIDSMQMLDPEDVAEAILFAVSRPDHVCVNELMIVPSGRE